MKTLLISAYSLQSQFIKNALSDLQTYKNDKYTWYKGKFYTKEIFLVDNSNNIDNMDLLLDLLMIDGGISQVITIGLGRSLNSNLRAGDVLISDQPFGSCQKLTELFLSSDELEDDDNPLRIFAGQIYNDYSLKENCESLACLDLAGVETNTSLRDKSLPALNIRLIVSEENAENLNSETYVNVVQKLLLLIKRAVEQSS